MRTRTLFPSLLAALFVLATHAAPAAAQTPNAYFVKPDTLDLSLDELRSGRTNWVRTTKTPGIVRVLLRSNTGDFRLDRVLQVYAPNTALVDSLPIRLTAVSDTATFREGTYVGSLEVRDPADKPLAQQVVRVTVPSTPAAATAVAATWSSEIYKGAPFPRLRTALLEDAASRCSTPEQPRISDSTRWVSRAMHQFRRGLRSVADRCVRDNVIPLAADTARPLIAPKTILGVLTDSAGDHAFVWWSGNDTVKVTADSVASPGLELQFASFDNPAIYTGRIDLTPGVHGGVVDLRVRVTHGMMWPFIAILLGVMLSYGLRRYLLAQRGILDLQERSAELQASFAGRSAEFDAAVQGVPGASRFRIDTSMLKAFEQADDRIRRLERVSGELKEGEPPYDEAVNLLNGLEQELAAWPAFGASLAGLHGDLEKTRAAAVAAGAHVLAPRGEPELAEAAGLLLQGGAVQRETLPTLHEQTRACRTLLGRWAALNERAADDATTLEQFTPEVGSEAETQHRDASRALRNAWAHLWRAEDDTQLTAADTALQAASTQVVALQESLPVTVGAAAATQPAFLDGAQPAGAEAAVPQPGGDARKIEIPNLRVWKPEQRTPEQERARRARRRRMQYGLAYLALTIVVAALTGLNQLYLDAPYFGSLQDYVLAVLWGFGTKLGMDVVRDTLESRQLPWPDFLTLRRRGQAPPQQPVQEPTPMGGDPAPDEG